MPKNPPQKLAPSTLEDDTLFATIRLRVHTPLPSDHPFYATVGRVASEWAHLEHILDLVIWDLVAYRAGGLGSNVVACITSQIMGVGPRCKAIVSLGSIYHLSEKKVLKPIRTLMGDLYVVADERARVIHDPWYMDKDSKVPAQFRAMPYSDKRYGLKDINDKEIEATITKIKALQVRASDLRNVVLSELEAFGKRLG